ncbi:MAG: VWA domain-containing protein [Chloroflexi bacterium]|nr:VWA domain-containing protein [Chloroflexota bacterium]
MTTPQPSRWSDSLLTRPRQSCRRVGIGCFLLVLLLLGSLCALLTLLLTPDGVSAAANVDSRPLQVWLLIDNSNSMYDRGGLGSDPDLLRLDAARLFLTYLGVDEPGLLHQAGVIFFGSAAELVVPLTPLADDAQRADLFAQIANPARLGWTDHLAALQLAQAEIEAADGRQGHPVIILLTDGKPELHDDLSPAAHADYLAALQAQSDRFQQAGVPLFLILLANETTDEDIEIAATWQPFWQTMSQATPPGRFYSARTAADLPDIYHDIVVALTGRESDGIVLSTAVTGETEAILPIPSGLAQLTLVVSKSDPAQEVTIQTAADEILTPDSPHVRRAGQNQGTLEEVWVIEQPPAGSWTVRITGPGEVTIWQDTKRLPPTAVAPTAILATASPTRLPAQSRPTQTPATLAVTPAPGPTSAATHTALLIGPGMTPTAVPPLVAVAPSPRRWTVWYLVGLGLAACGVGGLVWLRQARRPRVSGSVRVLTANGRLPQTIDLDDRRQTVVTIGHPPADIPLSGSMMRLTIRPGLVVGGVPQMLVDGPGELTLNEVPLSRPTPLFDMAIIDLGGGVKIRYEDLRLRRAARQNGWRSGQKRPI